MRDLELYDPLRGCGDDNLAVQRLLDMARGIERRSVSSPEEVARELGHYAHYNGGPYGMYHVLRDDDRTINALTHTAWFAHSLQFNAIAVAPEWRGQGVAKRLIYTFAQMAIARDIDDLWVYALRNSRASRVYAHLGMTVPSPEDERHPLHGRYYPMSASPHEIVTIAGETERFLVAGTLARPASLDDSTI